MRRALGIFGLILLAGCQYDPYAHLFTTQEPKPQDVAGSYVLTDQTITPGGLAVLQGRQCRLDLQPDGAFAITNYPTWTEAFSATNGRFAAFLSTTGRWSSETAGTVSNGRTGQSYWGVRFSDADARLESLALTGKAPPYGLIMTYGDPDSGTVLIFERKK